MQDLSHYKGNHNRAWYVTEKAKHKLINGHAHICMKFNVQVRAFYGY